MGNDIAIDGTRFLINGRPTYEGVEWRGKRVEGLLLNSRMVQAIFDDDCPETRERWRYPDTGRWDPDRNTDDFCDRLAEYRSYGLLAVTVGLQGGGSVYTPDIYDRYDNSAYRPDGSFKQPYFDRLLRVLKAADAAGIVVIVNYFYWKHVQRIPDDRVIVSIAERVTDWLLGTGYRNIMVDLANEAGEWWHRPLFGRENIPRLIETVKSITLNGRRLLAGSSSGGGSELAAGKWLAAEDFSMPHGNGLMPGELRAKIHRLRESPEYVERPRPICINEDSIFTENLDAAVEEYASWGFYCQGYGSGYRDRMDWTVQPRESSFDTLSGYQTLPVNWAINDPIKRAFFERVRAITGGG